MSDDRNAALTGEITQDEPQQGAKAVDGALVPVAALSVGMLVDMLEDGRFTADAHAEVRDMTLALKDQAMMTRRVSKGKITITLDVECEGDAYRIQPSIAVKMPKVPRVKSVAWADQQGRFTRFPPNQGQFFGVREAGGTGPVRSV